MFYRYFKIDNVECSSPGTIEGVSYFNYHTNVHHPMQGKCFEVYYMHMQIQLIIILVKSWNKL